VLERLSSGNGPISAVHYRDVRESMRNGGGPACLRLRLVLTEDEAARLHPGVVLTDALYEALVAWVNRHYRDRLGMDDLRDPAFVRELCEAYEALEGIFGLPGLYSEAIAACGA
jgi:succinylarginine dihydrolase